MQLLRTAILTIDTEIIIVLQYIYIPTRYTM